MRSVLMTRFFAMAALCCAPAYAVTFDWATVGNPGNPGNPFAGGIGSVDYSFRMATTEVTNAQYTEFLNAVDPDGDNDLDLYTADTGTPFGGMADNFGGIELQAGNPDGSKYVAQAGREQNPVSFVSFFDAMRFTNWLHNGQGSGGTESGAYTIGNGIDEVRSADARYWIPSLDESHKAGWYDPSLNGGAGGYTLYPTQSDAEPFSDNPLSLNTPDDTNVINGNRDDGIANGYDDGFAVATPQTGTASEVTTNPFTDVGAYTQSVSAYGTFDQGGNVLEWNEEVTITGVFFIPDGRGITGGAWDDDTSAARADNLSGFDAPTGGQAFYGFRVATVIPEPSTALLGALAAAGLLIRRRA